MTSLRRAGALLALSALSLAPLSAHGQSGESAAQAEALFREGKQLLKDGKTDQACQKLEGSYRLDPAIGTLMNLADCHEKLGKHASAWAEFLSASSLSKRRGETDRETVARDRATALEPKLIRLTIVVPPATKVDGLEVRRDGAVVDPASFGSATPVDPGKHQITARAPGRKESTTSVEASGEGKAFTVEVKPLAIDDTPKPVASAPATAAPTAAPPPPAPPPPRTRATVGLVLGGVGAAGIVVGSVFGLMAKSKWSSANCQNGICPTQGQQDDSTSAKGLATVGTVGFAVGGALLATGAVLYFTAPSGDSAKASLSVAPTAGTDGGGLLVRGRFLVS
jgi:hypothetical protein